MTTYYVISKWLDYSKSILNPNLSGIFFWGYYGTHYRARLYPSFGIKYFYKEYNLTRFNHQKNATHLCLKIRSEAKASV